MVHRLAKVRSGQVGGSQREFSADTRALLEQIWQREIAAPLGVDSYAQLRAHVADLARAG